MRKGLIQMKKALSLTLALMMAASMATSVHAAKFTPSVSGKEAPAVVTSTVVSEDGKKTSYVGQVMNQDGKEVKKLKKSQIKVIPVSKSKEASKEVKKELDAAYKQIKKAKTLNDLTPDFGKHLSNISKNLKVSNMVVRDLFDVTVDKNTEKLLEEGNSIQLTFKLDVKAKSKVVCMRSTGDGKWEIVDNSKVKNNGDGTVTVELNGAGPVAFVVEKQKATQKTLNSAN